jgi:hypothetical protein
VNGVEFGGSDDYGTSFDDLIKYLTSLDSKPTSFHISLQFDYFNTDLNLRQFRKLSTCMESCGCTGFTPKADCPDPNCGCNV